MFALNFELLPRDTVCHSERGGGGGAALLPPFPFSRHLSRCLQQRKLRATRWGIAPHKGNEHFATARRRQKLRPRLRLKLRQLRSLAKVANWLEQNGKWKWKRKAKERKGMERLFETQQHASRNRCEPQRSKAKRNQNRSESKQIANSSRVSGGEGCRGGKGEGVAKWGR